VANKYDIPYYFTDAEEMFRSAELDAVYIATPVFTHYDYAMMALKYDVHVLMEKPIALTAQEGKEILEAFEAKGKQIVIGYMMGFHNLHCKARELVRSGKLGDINLVRMQFSCWYPDMPGAWRQQKKFSGGGCIMDLAVHCMELFHSITGDEIDECRGFFGTQTFQYEVEDSAVISFRSKKGILGHIDANFNIPDQCSSGKLEIYGTSGSIYAEGTLGQEEGGTMKYIYSPQGDYEAKQSRVLTDSEEFHGEGTNIYTKQFDAFYELVFSKKTDYKSIKQAIHIQELCDKIYNQKK